MSAPQLVVIAGPNGAGKTSAAPALRKDAVGIDVFVNADVIAQGLSGFSPQLKAMEAGRLMLRRLRELAGAGGNFPFESTLSGRTGANGMKHALSVGYHVHILYLWLPSPELAIARVKHRVEAGGHDVPERDIRRRFVRSLQNFYQRYRPLATAWKLFDASGLDVTPVIAFGVNDTEVTVVDADKWKSVQHQALEG